MKFALYGFEQERRVYLVRWCPGDPRYPSPRDKFLSFGHRGSWAELLFLPISAKARYDADHPWDWWIQ